MRAVPQRPTFLPHPLAGLAASLALGIVLARFTNWPLKLLLPCALACSLAALYGYLKNWSLASSLMIGFAFFFMGATLEVLEKSSVTLERVQRIYDEGRIASGEPVEVTGVMTRAPEPAPDGFYLAMRVERLRFKGDERDASGEALLFASVRDKTIRAEYEALELRIGARLRVMCALNRAESFRNPGVSSLTEYLERRGVDATGAIKSPLLIERLDAERVFLPLAWL